MQGSYFAVGFMAEHDERGARPEPGEIDAETVRIVAVRVEAKASAHLRDRYLPANEPELASPPD